MKTKITFLCAVLSIVGPFWLGQVRAADSNSSTEAIIIDLEKQTWEAFKNKQSDAFKTLLIADYRGIYDNGVEDSEAETAGMADFDLGDYSFTDTKVTFPKPDVAVITYKAIAKITVRGKDASGTYNSGSVWLKKGGKWVTLLHTEVKAK